MTPLIGRTAPLLACLGLVGFAIGLAVAAGPPAAPAGVTAGSRCRVLVLNNGNLLEGAIRRVGERYQVALPGGQLEVRATDVRFTAVDRDDVYLRLRGTIANDSAPDHLRLAHWCIRWQLLGYAAREILIAREIDPKCAGIDSLRRQLRAATQAGQVTRTAYATQAGPRSVANPRRRERTLPKRRTGRASGKQRAGAVAPQPHRPARITPPTVRWPSGSNRSPSRDRQATTPRDSSPPNGRPGSTAERSPTSRDSSSSGKPSAAKVVTPRDPFDPEIFNSRQGGSR